MQMIAREVCVCVCVCVCRHAPVHEVGEFFLGRLLHDGRVGAEERGEVIAAADLIDREGGRVGYLYIYI